MPKYSKKSKLFDNLTKVTEQCVLGKSYAPLSEVELIARLKIPEQHVPVFREVLDMLKKRGKISQQKNRYAPPAKKGEVVSGIFRMNPRGFGFVETEKTDQYPGDVFIPKPFTYTAVDGDIVEVLINPLSVSEKGPEGKVIAIITRARTHMGAIVQKILHDGTIIGYAPLLGADQSVQIKRTQEPLRVGDRVVLKVIDWGSKTEKATAEFSHVLGNIEDPASDIPAAIENFKLRADFPSEVKEEAKSFGNRIKPSDLEGRLDLRKETIMTIDPDTAKDFDDALNISKDESGNFFLGVHIADVSYYVTKGSALDKEAKERANSTYFPSTCLPVLPKELSENLCSLKPNVQRLTVSVLMHFDPEGTLSHYEFRRSVIKSCCRFTYKQAKEILDGKKHALSGSLELMKELCLKLKKKRSARGSLEFSLPELMIHVDSRGNPTHAEKIEYDITHQMVEEFMLKANEIVATHLSHNGKEIAFRVHDTPAEENMRDFSFLASAFGFKISEQPTMRELQILFEEAVHTPYGQYLATAYIRKMRLAAYSSTNIGHFGLGLTHYCHFTSPIRRYADLIVHRVLFGEEQESRELDLIVAHCSDQERISAKAEQSVLLTKKLRFLSATKKSEPQKQYLSVITRVKPFGVFFEVIDLMLEGFLHLSELPDDYYVFDEGRNVLRGTRRKKILQAGDKLHVMVKNVDLIVQTAEWNFVAH